MISKLSHEFGRYHRHCSQLQHILKETQRILDVINLENFFPEENIIEELLPQLTLTKITRIIQNSPALVIFGQNTKAKASLVNHLLSSTVLPECNGSWRWIKIGYGQENHVALTLSLEYEVVQRLQANEKPWNTLPVEDLTKSQNEDTNCPTVLEIRLNHCSLKDGVQIFVAPNEADALQVLLRDTLKILPIFLYALGGEHPLSNEIVEELRNLREAYPYDPILFVSVASKDTELTEFTESEQHKLQRQMDDKEMKIDLEKIAAGSIGLNWLDQLMNLGFLRLDESIEVDQMWFSAGRQYAPANDLIDLKTIDRVVHFVRGCLQNYLVDASNYLNDVHTTGLRKFILSAFDMAREIQITPRRIQYAQQKENELYASMMKVVSEKQEELTELIQMVIQEMKEDVTLPTLCYITLNDTEKKERSAALRAATLQVQRYVLTRLGDRVAKQLVESVNCLRETFIGTLQRCLRSLEKNYEKDSDLLASDALKQILSAAYNVELHHSSPSFIRSFVDRLWQLVRALPLSWAPTPVLDASWKKKVTTDVLNSLSAARLARAISTQFRDKVKSSHDTFQTALKSLENHYSGKLERTEEQRVAIRKYHAPRMAKLALESTSMSDLVRFGIPHQAKEIGRGQYGVVFACDAWPGAPGPCAVKSVVPPDEKHWNDLAMEFYYTRSIPDHKRIVKLRGSVIDHSYGGGGGGGGGCGFGAAVLLITDRMNRDLYCGIRAGLSWLERIQIAVDVLEGIRYLHSQGLVHRDIKLKNVLLDKENRAKLTDLGFCIPEAMMSGSIVGTPVHMAPELLSGHYDSSVDVYAFGILFWYICAGHVRLPYAFEQFHNKEQLWTSVRKGIRPERLSHFDSECWKLMEQCWAGEPSRRPLLGAILPVLESVRKRVDREGKSLTELDEPEQPLKHEETNTPATRNPALALSEPYNQRGTTIPNSSVSSRRKRPRFVKRPIHHMTNILQASVCSNLYIHMREF